MNTEPAARVSPDAAKPSFNPRLGYEIAIVLGLSLGASAMYSILKLIARLTEETPLAQQTAALNPSQSDRAWLDASYQLFGILFDLMPVLLVFYLLSLSGRKPFNALGFTAHEPFRDARRAVSLLLIIGVPGLAVYFLGRELGLTVNIIPAPLESYWWSIPLLILSALRAALVEEVIVIGYLYDRLRWIGWNKWLIIVSTALLRGSYHLYQGIGPFFGNLAMGVVFGWLYTRWGRLTPLVIAHWMLDIASFVGYAAAVAAFPELFR